MFHRKREFGPVTIEATFQWDNGDPSVGISAGWGEETGAEITARLSDSTRVITWITWRDFTTRDDAPSLQDSVKSDDPGTWLIESVQTEQRQDSGHSIVLAEAAQWYSTLTLSALPEVLEVVRDAWEDAMASERLSAARENVQMAEAWRDEQAHLAAEGEHAEVGEAEAALEQARRELGNAEVVAQNRGVVV